MKIKGKFTRLLDGGRVYDVNLLVNSRSKKYVIISCDSEHKAINFVSDFAKLLKKHTVERITEISMGTVEES